MITHSQVEKYLLSMPSAYLDYPFGEGVAVYKVFIPNKKTSSPHVDGVQGATEQRNEPYIKYGKRAAQVATQQSATNSGGAVGFADWQAAVMRGEGEGKMFALVPEKPHPVSISLKCDPVLAETLRAKYDTVMPGYHLNKKHWNTIVLSGQLSWEEIQDLIRHSYSLVAAS